LQREIIIPSKLLYIKDVRLFLEDIFNDLNIDRAYFNRIFLGLSEVVNNSIVHGNQSDEGKNVFVRSSFSDRELVFEIMDEGEGFLEDSIQDPTSYDNLKKENGRGLFLIKQIADEIIFSEGGRRVLLRFNLDK
jgi:serine/threonine-protein kinase RsbW